MCQLFTVLEVNDTKIKDNAWSRQPIPAFVPGKSLGQRSLAGYSPWGHGELDVTEQLVLSSTIGRVTCFTQCTD